MCKLYVLLPNSGFTAILEINTRTALSKSWAGGGSKSKRKEENSEARREKG